MSMFSYSGQAALAVLSDDPLVYFSWPTYFVFGAIYTAFAFSGELSKEGPLIFSKRNARPLSAVFIVHLAFLTILYGFLRVATYMEPSLPNWLTKDVGRSVSVFNVFFLVALLVMQFIERRWLFVESEPEDSAPK